MSQSQRANDPSRTAFTFGPVLSRKDSVRITCVAVDPESQRLFVGLTSGQVEEYQLTHSEASLPSCRLLSERRISRHAAISELCCLPVAMCLVVRTDDGSVHLAAYETSVVHLLPGSKGSNATKIAGDAMRAPSRLAVAVRTSSVLGKAARASQLGVGPAGTAAKNPPHSSKVLVYAVNSGPGGISHSAQPAHLLARVTIPEPVLDLAWVKDGILAAVPGGYQLIQSGCKVLEVAPGVTTKTMLAACPPIQQALMLFADAMLLLVDSQGAAIREPFLLPDRPVAIALTSAFVIAVTDEAILVYDSSTAQLVQQVAFAHDDAWVAASGRLPSAEDVRSGGLVIATASTVSCLQPVELEHQVWELLKQHRYTQAISLTGAAMRTGLPWAGPAMAQAGLLLLHSMRVREAMEALEACPEDAWQPAQLLPLFPSVTSRWLAEAPASRAYWGLHGPGPLQTLLSICNHCLDIQKAKLEQQSHVQQHQRQQQHQQQQPADAEALMAEAKAHIASYIIRVRHRPATACLEALDTLAVVLMSEAGQAGPLEAFLSTGGAAAAAAATAAMVAASGRHVASHPEQQDEPAALTPREGLLDTSGPVSSSQAQAPAVQGPPCQAALRESVRGLELGGRWHALGLLRAARNHLEEALGVWQGLAQGRLQEAPAASGAASSCGGSAVPAAVASACAVLLEPGLAPTSLVLQQLPWLLAHGPRQALTLLRERHDVSVESALALLEGHTGDVRWEYLQHLVYGRDSDQLPESALHTELALELVECIQREHEQQQQQGQQHQGQHQHHSTANAGVSEHVLQLDDGDRLGSSDTGRSGQGEGGELPDMDSCLAALESYCRREQQQQWKEQRQRAEAEAEGTSSFHQHRGTGSIVRGGAVPGLAGAGGDVVAPLLLAAVQEPAAARSTPRSLTPTLAPTQSLLPRLLRLRAALLLHLHRSGCYDAGVVLAAMGPLSPAAADPPSLVPPPSTSSTPTGPDPGAGPDDTSRLSLRQAPAAAARPLLDSPGQLLRERVVLQCRLGAHAEALALLAFRLGDVDACIAYCRHQAGKPGSGGGAGAAADASQPHASWLMLLELLLNPGAGRQPLYSAAVRVLHEEGGSLSPLQVLAALPDAMPLQLGADTLMGMLAGVTHRRRQTQVVRGLQRACNLTSRSHLAELSSQRVVISEDSACHGCHRLLLDRVVYRYPSSAMLLCARCVVPVATASGEGHH